MAVIPPDAGVRMRTQSDPGQLQALAPVRGIPAGLPEFQPGQNFTARIQELLPDSTYKALVAGRQLTLQLPEGANPGDVLELTVVDRSAHTVIARRAEGQPPLPGQIDARAYPYARISDAGRMIGQLLPAEGEAPQPAALTRGQPILAQAPASGGQLANALRTAVSQSGLFYEAHQAQWVAGERPLTSLRAEPQGQLPVAPRPTTNLPSGPTRAETGAQSAGITPQDASRAEPSLATRVEFASRTAEPPSGRTELQSQATASSTTQQSSAATVPDSIRLIVQQQLDAVATQRLAWHGEVWPGQTMDWAIQRDAVEDRDASAVDATEAPRWSTSLRLTMPTLGTVDAVVQLVGDRLRIRLAADENAVGALRRQAANLTDALANAGLAVQSLDIRHEG